MFYYELNRNPTILVNDLSKIIIAKGIYTRQPALRHFRAVKAELMDHLAKNSSMQMAAMESCANLLRILDQKVSVTVISGKQLKEARLKAAQLILNQSKKAGFLPRDERFHPNTVDLFDIPDIGRYYGGFLFIPNVADHLVRTARKTISADAEHYQRIGPQSYRNTFEVILYDGNNHVTEIAFPIPSARNPNSCGTAYSELFRPFQASTAKSAVE